MTGASPAPSWWAPYEEREARLLARLGGEFRVDRFEIVTEVRGRRRRAWIDFTPLDGLLRLEMQWALQQRVDARLQPSGHLNTVVQLAARHSGVGVGSFVDRELASWELRLRSDHPRWKPKSAEPFVAVLRCAHRGLVDMYDGRAEFDRDVWDLRRLGYADEILRGSWPARMDFSAIDQLWLRDVAKSWLRSRVHAGRGVSTLHHNRRHVIEFAAWLADHQPYAVPVAITRADVIEPYISEVRTSGRAPYTQSRNLGDVRCFLEDCRRHGWCSFPEEATIYNDEFPKERSRLPRYLDERTMSQLEAKLDRLPDGPTRRIVVLLIETGRRAGELCTIDNDCVIHDGDGHPYLRYYQSKMRKEHTIPINERTLETIEEQQAWVRQRWPGGSPWLFPRLRVNPDGAYPFVYGTLRTRIRAWAKDCGICDASGNPVEVTAHRFRHTVGTRLVNADVRLETIQAYYGHDAITMTGRYAKIHDQTVKQEFLRYEERRFSARGEPVQFQPKEFDDDARWLRHRLTAQALPNGYCGLPTQSQCPHANACLTCDHFETDVTFLPIHRNQLAESRKIVAEAKTEGHQRQAEMNQRVCSNLEQVVEVLEQHKS